MSVQTEVKPVPEPRPVLGPTGNRVVSDDTKPKKKTPTESLKKTKQDRHKTKALNQLTASINNNSVKNNTSLDSSSDSSSSSSSSMSVKSIKRSNGVRAAAVKVAAPQLTEVNKQDGPVTVKRCDWITPNSDPVYMLFHDEEWGVPVYGDDRKLFELLVFSQALAELSWPAILHMRDLFRKLFDNFDASSVAQFSEKKLLSLKANGNLVLSEPKLRAIVENARQITKVQQEFSTFSNYFWRFVNHKALQNGFRYNRQVPVKTPKADCISKDLMNRGFRCVGPTVVYSFMQASGMVNDHVISCFRYQECCNANVNKDSRPKTQEPEIIAKALDSTCLIHD